MSEAQPQVNLNELMQSALAAERAGVTVGNWRDIAIAVYNAAAQHVSGLEEQLAALKLPVMKKGAATPASQPVAAGRKARGRRKAGS